MFFKPHFILLVVFIRVVAASSSDDNGFIFIRDLKMDGVEEITPEGLVMVTNKTTTWGVGHTFYSRPFRFKNSSEADAVSFSTTFVFGIIPENPYYNFHGMTFAITPSKDLVEASSSQHLGLFNRTNDGQPSNHIVAVELDTFQSLEIEDINSNHVGLDINSIVSVNSTPAGYYVNDIGEFKNITLASSQEIQAWVEYDGVEKQLNVTLAPLRVDKPIRPLLSIDVDISPFLLDEMYVGFSSSTGVLLQSYYVLGWSFQLNGPADELDLSKLSSLPRRRRPKKNPIVLAIGLSIFGLVSVTILSLTILFMARRKSKFNEVLEDWEVEFGPHRFPYKDLYIATKGFKETELLGRGGFGQVYKGVLPELNVQVAVKKISHESSQGMKEFVAEIATIGRIRHPNLVRLLGYCRRKGELFLVYDFMPNTSLDKFLFHSDKPEANLSWSQRFKIIKDVAEGLAYLHEEWAEVIIHRDIKASNVLLDGEMNGKLGDFGLARCVHHGKDAETTHLAGTLGYIAPELARKGKATRSTDVFAFGAFCLEVACGRRPVESRAPPEEVILIDWVLSRWWDGDIYRTVDGKLKNDFKVEEMGLVLKLGLLCSHSVAAIRPRMSQVLLCLKGHASMPENFDALLGIKEGSGRLSDGSISTPSPSQMQGCSIQSLTITELFTSIGR